MKNWKFINANPDKPWSDVIPLDDEQPHQNHSFEASKSCHCKPRVDTSDEDGTPLAYPMVVHMAFDGRHIVEQAEAIIENPDL